MYDDCWSNIIRVELPEPHGVKTIRTTREAADCLMDQWGDGLPRPDWDNALRICLDVYERMAVPSDAQAAFISAILEAGYPYAEHAMSD